ncbi:hypothetical protein MGY77_000207 [Enterococcus faecalis]|uniref:hypothetical protein n=1 Tax=Enterococcus faecalis TaxID=1351 RepID=UPI001A0B829C|nr:hypothetical protein [Enterococcus faecalis]EGO8404085.1 hypothetical protein [Enterococcus faecalis]EGO8898134.1 hypothetical protein [Enterococcus faecalis]EGO9036423.1 hypothetical protein [Enterococcus faecalis]EGO9188886.1 hypothetical protein [Enterococcus faecalis]EIW9706781.1 hypothetical protein [Enterococcus faecalis]
MLTAYNKFKKKHPYLNLIILFIAASLIGILIEYIINKDFIGSGFYTALFLMLFYIIKLWMEQKK